MTRFITKSMFVMQFIEIFVNRHEAKVKALEAELAGQSVLFKYETELYNQIHNKGLITS